jgi:DNA polymerase III delta subunit
MVKLFYGNDVVGVRHATTKWLESFEKTDLTIVRYTADGYVPGLIKNLLSSVSLFGGASVVVFDSPREDVLFNTELQECLAELVAATELFAVIEQSLLAAELKPYKTAGVDCEEFKKTSEDRFNPFSLNEALLLRDKKILWVLLQEAKQKQIPTEELIGIVWWQLKVLRLAACTNTAAEADQKDYPYKKAKQALSRFKSGELESLSASLLQVYHDGHGGVRDIDVALEEWVLRV